MCWSVVEWNGNKQNKMVFNRKLCNGKKRNNMKWYRTDYFFFIKKLNRIETRTTKCRIIEWQQWRGRPHPTYSSPFKFRQSSVSDNVAMLCYSSFSLL